MDNNSIIIDQYLQNEMTAAERSAFETRLSIDIELRKELRIQQQIVNAAGNAGLKMEFGKAIRKKILIKKLLISGVIAITVAAVVFLAIKNNWFGNHASKQSAITNEIPLVEKFELNTLNDTIIETKDGVVFAIPAGAFKTENKSVNLEIKTALSPADIMKQGLSTVSETPSPYNGIIAFPNDRNLLRTAGMFAIKAFENGKEISLQKEISVNVPANKIDPAMQLFDGIEDSSGHVNWVNPKPLDNSLRTYDITTLDFYPPDYIPTLKGLEKDYINKKYTDSLYYSFSAYGHIPANTSEIKEKNANDYAQDDVSDSVPDSENNTQKFTTDYNFHYEINPSKIKAILNNKFNNTILATKEFEERLKFLHSLCDGFYLNAYVAGIKFPMYHTDSVCAIHTSGEVRKKFLQFAARKDGSVKLASGLQQQLSIYFQQKSAAFKAAEEKTWSKYQDELNGLNKIADEKQRAQEINDFKRENKNFEEELNINVTDAYRQIGQTHQYMNTNPPPKTYYEVQVITTGWKNLDAYVYDATMNRESMTYTDPVSGKTAKIIYNPVSIQIQDRQAFDKVMVYLIPDSLGSFQLVKETATFSEKSLHNPPHILKTDTSFNESLNALFNYDVVVLAYKNQQPYFFQQHRLLPKKYLFTLSATSNKEINDVLQIYSVNKSTALKSEFEYRLFEQQEMLRQVQLRKDMDFREKIAAAIFKCAVPTAMPADSTKEVIIKH